MKAIETRYKGYRFRSRLEARWAVFFSALGLKWEYEPEGFDLGAVGRYLPDFFLPELNGGIWVEVKPNASTFPSDKPKWLSFVAQGKAPLLLAIGTPVQRSYIILTPPDPEEGGRSVQWDECCFNSKYLPPQNHDGQPRLFWFPGGLGDADCFDAINAARGARFEHGEVPL